MGYSANEGIGLIHVQQAFILLIQVGYLGIDISRTSLPQESTLLFLLTFIKQVTNYYDKTSSVWIGLNTIWIFFDTDTNTDTLIIIPIHNDTNTDTFTTKCQHIL